MYTSAEYLSTVKTKRPTGVLVYAGPSALTGRPIVSILTFGSTNVKTADMAQLWILPAEEKPTDAANSGADADVCGDCIHRGRIVDGKNVDRTCYVTLIHGPRAVFDAYKRGRYPVASPDEAGRMVAGRPVRLGAWGDPAALPAGVVRAVVALASRHTGYTHQWESGRPTLPGLSRGSGPELQDVCMASADSAAQADTARAAGFRYFRVTPVGADSLGPAEISCPASAEAGKVTTCDRCALCSGSTTGKSGDRVRFDGRKNIVIQAHGAGAGRL